MLMTFLQVAAGGAIGAAMRFGVGLGLIRAAGDGFPIAIMAVNIIGSFLMGIFVIYSFHKGLAHLNPFVMTGVLGGFTTFSAFSLELFTLYERGQLGAAALYLGGSVVLSVLALALGVMLARGLWA